MRWLVTLACGGFAIIVFIALDTIRANRKMRAVWKKTGSEPLKTSVIHCPMCGHTDHEYKAQGWDTIMDKATGRRWREFFNFAICKACGSRWAKRNNEPVRVPSAEDWEAYVTSLPDPEYQWAKGHDPLL